METDGVLLNVALGSSLAVLGTIALGWLISRSGAPAASDCPKCGYRQFTTDRHPRPRLWSDPPPDGHARCVECGHVFVPEPTAGVLRHWLAARDNDIELGPSMDEDALAPPPDS